MKNSNYVKESLLPESADSGSHIIESETSRLIAAAFVCDDGSPEWRNTVVLLGRLYHEIVNSKTPPSLSAAGLERQVFRCDCLGPAQMGFYYPRQLHFECEILIPRALTPEDWPGWSQAIYRWNNGRRNFRCATIGPILQINKICLENWVEKNDAK